MSLKSGTNSFHGVGYDFMRRKALAANSFLLNSQNRPKTDQLHRSVRVQRRRPDLQEQDVLPVHRREIPGRHARRRCSARCRRGDEERRLQRSRGRAGRQIVIYDPATGRDVNGVWTRDPFPGNIIPADRINPTARAIMQYWPDPNDTTAGVAPWQQNLHWAEHFNKDLFWNWVGKVDHNFGANDRAFFRWGENERNEIGNRGATPSAAVPARTASFRSGAPTARSSATGCTSSGRARSSTCAAATPISSSGAIPSTRSVSIRRSSGPRASSTRCRARRSAASSRDRDRPVRRPCRAARPRTGTATTRFSRTCR